MLEQPNSVARNEHKRTDKIFSNQNPRILKCRDYELILGSKTFIMGVLNLTPDSFYDGGKFNTSDKALNHVEKMISEGADIIDIGGESTRPGSRPVSVEEELERVIPVVRELNRNFDAPLSVDTTKSEVAEEALKEGASIINDISGLKFDEKIADIVAEYGAALLVSHTSERPEIMQENTQYTSLMNDIRESLSASIGKALEKGVESQSIIVDPGFGFGKTVEQNLLILKNLDQICELGMPVLIGTSNKSFIGKVLDSDVGQRVEGTAATIAIGIANGASIVRVHNIGQMKKVAAMTDAVINAS